MSNLEKSLTKSGASTSRLTRLDYIPHHSLIRLAKRLELGAVKHSIDNWKKGLNDPDYLCERLSHTINHCYNLINKIRNNQPLGDDDAAAIMWGGMFACEFTKDEFQEKLNDSTVKENVVPHSAQSIDDTAPF